MEGGRHPLLDELRAAELEAALLSFPVPPARVLEIGAGSGWQAALLRSAGYEVAAVDVAVDRTHARHHPVLAIDGCTLPFAGASFDVVFSSNVLEHVADLSALLAEIERVLVPAGRSVHLIPTRTWRALSMLTFYLGAPTRIRLRRHAAGHETGQVSDLREHAVGARSLRRIVEAPHGEFDSAAQELLEYGRRRWIERLRAGHANRPVETYPAGIVYTGYGLAPYLTVPMRRRLARVLGSACLIYVSSPITDASDAETSQLDT